jgi:hypothetical protein
MSVRHSGGVSANPDGPETRPTEATSADAEPYNCRNGPKDRRKGGLARVVLRPTQERTTVRQDRSIQALSHMRSSDGLRLVYSAAPSRPGVIVV